MRNLLRYDDLNSKYRFLLCLVLFEYLLFIFSGTSFSFLSGNTFFSLGADPVTWVFYLAKIPQTILAHRWMGILMDSVIILLLLLFIRDPNRNRIAICLFILLLLYYVTLMGHLAHRNYQFGFFLVFIPFLFRKENNKRFAFEATRYFLLFFYVSAAILKLTNSALAAPAHLSHLISGQFTPYFLEGNTGLRTDVNLFLVSHPFISSLLFKASFIAELMAVIGFFTKRFDKWLAVLLLTFHFTNWFLMDIAPFGQLAFICLLWLSQEMKLQPGD